LEYAELRPLVLEALKMLANNRNIDLETIIDKTDFVARSKGFYKEVVRPYTYSRGHGGEKYMPREDREKARHIVWELILQGVLMSGHDEFNPNLPFVLITTHGKEVLNSGELLPYDPDGYLRTLKSEIQNLDPIIEDYVFESLQAYQKGLMLSCAVMLGGASEKAFLIFLQNFTNALTNSAEKKRFQELQECIKTKYKFDQAKNKLMSIRSTLPKELGNELEFQFDGIFNLIRLSRNDAGHPSGRKVGRDEAFAYLIIFKKYCRKVYDLTDYFSSHPI
jgi:hypothetical protein